MNLLASYETLLGLSQEMEALARQQAWDALTQLETQRAALLAALPATPLTALPIDRQRAIAAKIRQIQTCDKAVLEYVLPWQEHVGKLLARLAAKP